MDIDSTLTEPEPSVMSECLAFDYACVSCAKVQGWMDICGSPM